MRCPPVTQPVTPTLVDVFFPPIHHIAVCSINCHKVVKRSLVSRFVHNPKNVKFTVIEEERNWELVTWKKLKSQHFDFYFLKKLLKLINSRRSIK